ncbi:hypothetical protein ABZ721_18365 [Streptomyces sp. NPDC006733]|uniref:hypothetical protein n=1 Tax=Streptomyces sp. NPDC006733 TaxID=3155460 RepID=UPI0033CB6468
MATLPTDLRQAAARLGPNAQGLTDPHLYLAGHFATRVDFCQQSAQCQLCIVSWWD